MIETRALHVFVQVKGQDGVFVSVPACLHSEVDGSNIGAFAHSQENATYKENFKSLEKLVLVMAEDDTMASLATLAGMSQKSSAVCLRVPGPSKRKCRGKELSVTRSWCPCCSLR